MSWCRKTYVTYTCGHRDEKYNDCESPAHGRDPASLVACQAAALRRWSNQNTHIIDYTGHVPGAYCSRNCNALYEGWYCGRCPERMNSMGQPIPGRPVITDPAGLTTRRPYHIADDGSVHL
jgi:hypothetical protein